MPFSNVASSSELAISRLLFWAIGPRRITNDDVEVTAGPIRKKPVLQSRLKGTGLKEHGLVQGFKSEARERFDSAWRHRIKFQERKVEAECSDRKRGITDIDSPDLVDQYVGNNFTA